MPAPRVPVLLAAAGGVLLLLGVGLGPWGPLSAHPHDPPRPPNVVVVLVDTLRFDHTTVGRYARDTTPNLARIAGEGLSFERHFANAPWTKPSVASILTGLHPSAHGSRTGQFETFERIEQLRAEGRAPSIEVLSPRLDTLPELLERAGWYTAAFVTNYHLTPKFGYHQGFREYGFLAGQHDDARNVDETLRVLRAHTGPVFVWCHLMDVHEYHSSRWTRSFRAERHTPLGAANDELPGFRAYETLEELVDRYDRAVASTDRRLGRLFDSIRRDEPNTLLIVTSDHGEEFLEHGGLAHATTLYAEQLRVPLVVWGPGVPRARVEALTDSLDVLPTVLAAVGLEPAPGLPGRPLFADGRAGAGKDEVLAEQHHRGPEVRAALIRRDGKLIVSRDKRTGAERDELYGDPLGPERERWEAPPGVGADMRARLEALTAAARAHFDEHIGSSELERLDPRDIEELWKLGYVEGDPDGSEER